MTPLPRPKGLPFLCVAIAGHAFAWYSVYNLFALYLVELGASQAHAMVRFGVFVAWAYVAVLLGGFVSGGGFGWSGIGPRRTALLGALVASAGYVALWQGATAGAALAPLLIGCGLLKPTISAMVGTMYPAGSADADRAFGKFYACLNLGATGSPAASGVVLGVVAGVEGYRACFGLAAAGDLVVAACLLLGWRHLARAEQRSSVAAALDVADADGSFPPDETPKWPELRGRVLGLAVVLGLAAVGFWPAYLQNGSGQVLWALEHTDRAVASFWMQALFGDEVQVPWFSAVNTVLCIVGTPILVGVISRARPAPGGGRRPLALSTVLVLGYLTMCASFAVLAAAPQQGRTSPLWLLASIVLGSASEVCVSTYGLVQVNRLAPRRYVPACMSLFYVTVAVGGWLSSLLAAATAGAPPRVPFAILAATSLCAAGVGFLAAGILDRAEEASSAKQEALQEQPSTLAAARQQDGLAASLGASVVVSPEAA